MAASKLNMGTAQTTQNKVKLTVSSQIAKCRIKSCRRFQWKFGTAYSVSSHRSVRIRKWVVSLNLPLKTYWWMCWVSPTCCNSHSLKLATRSTSP
jgi:hypothetical protein